MPDQNVRTRIIASGDLDSSSSIRSAIRGHLREQPAGEIEVDLTGVTFLDSGGIRILLNCLDEAEQAGCRFCLINPNPLVRRVLEITGLLDVFAL
jgi:anti-anti-sigma factor